MALIRGTIKKITDLTEGTPKNTDPTIFVDVDNDETKQTPKVELKGDAATVDVGTTTTLAAGESATVTNIGTTAAAIFNFAIPQGIQGLTGADGACVESVAFVGNDIVFTLDDASTVTLTNAKTDLKGDTGAKIISGAFVGDDLVFTLDDNSTATVTGAKTDLQGIQGIQGIQGETGNGISDISLISTVGLVKTYRITYTDNTTFDYTVTDGANGTGTLSSVVAGTNISIDNTDVNNPIINNTQDISGKLDSNTAITGATKTKITYDAKGLVTAGEDATTDDIAESTNKKYITDAEKTAIGTIGDKAPLASPNFTGTVTLPITQLGENSLLLDETLSGDEKWSGITTKGTAGATLAVGDVCYLASSGKWLLNDGILDGTDTGFDKQLGICVLASTDTQPTEMLLYGKIRSAAFPSFTVGSPVYLDDTAGDLVVAKPSTTNFCIRKVGFAITAEDLFFNPSTDFSVVK